MVQVKRILLKMVVLPLSLMLALGDGGSLQREKESKKQTSPSPSLPCVTNPEMELVGTLIFCVMPPEVLKQIIDIPDLKKLGEELNGAGVDVTIYLPSLFSPLLLQWWGTYYIPEEMKYVKAENIYLDLAERDVENIRFVPPTPVLPDFKELLRKVSEFPPEMEIEEYGWSVHWKEQRRAEKISIQVLLDRFLYPEPSQDLSYWISCDPKKEVKCYDLYHFIGEKFYQHLRKKNKEMRAYPEIKPPEGWKPPAPPASPAPNPAR